MTLHVYSPLKALRNLLDVGKNAHEQAIDIEEVETLLSKQTKALNKMKGLFAPNHPILRLQQKLVKLIASLLNKLIAGAPLGDLHAYLIKILCLINEIGAKIRAAKTQEDFAHLTNLNRQTQLILEDMLTKLAEQVQETKKQHGQEYRRRAYNQARTKYQTLLYLFKSYIQQATDKLQLLTVSHKIVQSQINNALNILKRIHPNLRLSVRNRAMPWFHYTLPNLSHTFGNHLSSQYLAHVPALAQEAHFSHSFSMPGNRLVLKDRLAPNHEITIEQTANGLTFRCDSPNQSCHALLENLIKEYEVLLRRQFKYKQEQMEHKIRTAPRPKPFRF